MSAAAVELASVPWPVLLIGAYQCTVATVAVVIYLIAKAAINKADARDLPQVLAALVQVLDRTARSVPNLPPTSRASQDTPASTQAPDAGGQPQ